MVMFIHNLKSIFNALNDGKNYTLKADESKNIGDMTQHFKVKNGVMEQYRSDQ